MSCLLNKGMTAEEYLSTEKKARQIHLNLDLPCLERGGISTNHRGVLAQYLDTPIFGRPANLCHACGNDKCSTPVHLYWGSYKENLDDAKAHGTWTSGWSKVVAKYGYERACKMNSRPSSVAARGGKANRGIPKSVEHRQKISKSLRERSPTAEAADLSPA